MSTGPDTQHTIDTKVKQAVDAFFGYLTPKGEDEFNRKITEVLTEYKGLVEEYKKLKEKEKKLSFINDIKTKLQGTDLFTEEFKKNIKPDIHDRPDMQDGGSVGDAIEDALLTVGAVAVLAVGLFFVGTVLSQLSNDQLDGVAIAAVGADPIEFAGFFGGSKHKKRKGRKSKKTKKSMKHKKGRKSKKAKKSMKKRKSMKKKKSMKKRK